MIHSHSESHRCHLTNGCLVGSLESEEEVDGLLMQGVDVVLLACRKEGVLPESAWQQFLPDDKAANIPWNEYNEEIPGMPVGATRSKEQQGQAQALDGKRPDV